MTNSHTFTLFTSQVAENIKIDSLLRKLFLIHTQIIGIKDLKWEFTQLIENKLKVLIFMHTLTV